MKKLIVLLCLLGISLTGFSQATTIQSSLYKIKVGHNLAFRAALEDHVNKFRKSGSPYELDVFYITGGTHRGEYRFNTRVGFSWEQRDASPSLTPEMQNDFAKNVAPHIEGITGGETYIYSKKNSNTPFKSTDTNPSRTSRTMMWYLKFSPPTEFWDVVGKYAKYWDKRGHLNIVLFSATGPSTLSFVRRLPNGLKELDGANVNREVWEELYGKDSFDKDMATMRPYIGGTEQFFATRVPSLSSK